MATDQTLTGPNTNVFILPDPRINASRRLFFQGRVEKQCQAFLFDWA